MNVAGMARTSWRLERAELSRLSWAFAISVALHLLIVGGYYGGKHYHLWENLRWPAWLQPVKTLLEKAVTLAPPPPLILREQDEPTIYVDVSEAQATPEPPKAATYYSDKNSLAANPAPDKETDLPKITGVQKDFPKTEDAAREKYKPLQPSPPAPKPENLEIVKKEPKQAEEKAKPTEAPGDLTMAKPDPNPKKDTGDAPKPRPRTIEEALARMQPQSRPPGMQMLQEGGVHRRSDFSLDTKATEFGEYDRALIDAVRQYWYHLLDDQKYAADYSGKVILQFDLHSDGRITGLKVSDNNAGDIPGWLCQTAIDRASPYHRFPPDMRRSVGETRHIQFSFFYY